MSESLPTPLPITLAKNIGLGLSDFRRGMTIHKNQRAALNPEQKYADRMWKAAGAYFFPLIGFGVGGLVGLLVSDAFVTTIHDLIPNFQPPVSLVEGGIVFGSFLGNAVGLLSGAALSPQGRRGRHERERLAKNPSPIQLHK